MIINPIMAIRDGYIPSTILASFFKVEPRLFTNTTLESIRFKKLKLIKIPTEAVKYMSSEYTVAVIKQGEDESEYDYILPLSKSIKVGFWK